MADRTVGIEFFISAPNIKSKLDEIADGWDEIIDQEINAQKAHDAFIKSAAEGVRQIDAENKLLRKVAEDMMNSVRAQKIAVDDSLLGIKQLDKEIAKASTTQEKGLATWIKGLFSAKKAQEEVKKAQEEVTKAVTDHNKAVDVSMNRLTQLTAQQVEGEKKLLQLRKEMNTIAQKPAFTDDDRARLQQIKEEYDGINAGVIDLTKQISEINAEQVKLAETADGVNKLKEAADRSALGFAGAKDELKKVEEQIIIVTQRGQDLKERASEIAEEFTSGNTANVQELQQIAQEVGQIDQALVGLQQQRDELQGIINASDEVTELARVEEAIKSLTSQLVIMQKEAAAIEKEFSAGNFENAEELKAIGEEVGNINNELRLLQDRQVELRDITQEAHEVEKKGLVESIRGFFNKRKELEEVESQIKKVNSELLRLRNRQKEITSSTTGKILPEFLQEGNDIENKIRGFNAQLGDLTDRQKKLGGQTEDTGKKTGGLTAILSKVGKIGGAAFLAIGAAVVGAGLLIFNLGRQNELVQKQFEKAQKQFNRARHELSSALAPIAFSIGKVFENIAKNIADSLEENSDKIYNWARNFAGIIGGLAAAIPIEVKKISFVFKRLAADVELSLALLKLASTAILAPKERRDEALAEFEAAKKKVFDLNEEIRKQPESTAEAYERGSKRMLAAIDKIGLAGFKVKSLTDEQRKAIEALRKELNSLTADLSKQLEVLNIRQAGPFAGVLLSATLSIRAIEAQGEKAVSLARKLGESQEKINQIQAAVSRLADAVRQDAIKVLTDQSDEIITGINKKLDDLKASRAGTEEALRFRTALQAQFRELQTLQEIQRTLIDDAKNRGEATEVINDLVAGLQRANKIANELASNTALSFLENAVVKQFEGTKGNIEKQLKLLTEQSEKLKKAFESITDGDTRRSIAIQISVKETEIKVAEERIRQFENAFEIFQKTGVLGVIEAEAVIRARIERVDEGIGSIQPGEIPAPKISGLDKLAKDLKGVFEDVKFELEGIFGEDFVARYAGAFEFMRDIAVSSIDSQIEAIQNLVETRQQAVSDLEKDIEFEAILKANGLANDFDILKKELDEERQLRDEAAQKQFDLQAKRDKIQRREDSLNQASALATAIANVFRGTAGNPIATAFAFVLSGLLLAKFAAAKIQAAKLARAYKGSSRLGETFGEIAPGEGHDDRPGQDRGLLVVDRRGRLRGQIGGDEALMKESVSRKHRRLLHDMNVNEHKYDGRNLLDELLSMKPVKTISAPDMSGINIISHIEQMAYSVRRAHDKAMRIKLEQGAGMSKKDVEEAVDNALDRQTTKIINYLEQRPTFVDDDIKNIKQITAKSIKKIRKG